MGVSAKDYFFMDEEQQRPLVEQCATRIAPVIGGQLKWRDEGSELHVTGYYQGRPVRLTVWVSFGTVKIELKATRAYNFDAMFHMQVDADAAKHAGESMTRDEWDDADGTEQKLFLAPNVYFEGEPQELAQLRGMLQRLPQDGANALVQTLASFDRGSFMVTGDTLVLDCPAWVTLHDQAPQYVGYYLNMMLLLSQAMEQCWR